MPAKARKLDFTKVKDRGQFNPKHMPEGDYRAVVVDVHDAKANDTNRPMWVYTIRAAGGTYPYRVMLSGDNVLWKVKLLFEACGFKIPKRLIDTDPNKVVNKKLGVSLIDHEYQGKLSSEIAQVFHIREFDDEAGRIEGGGGDVEEEDEDETPRRKARPAVDEVEADEDAEDEEDEDEEPPPPRKKQRPRQVVEDEEDEDVDEDEEEEPAPPPKKKRKPVVVEDEDDADDLDEIDIEDM
jgi:hypothetical protein